jgi:hypothetical protein
LNRKTRRKREAGHVPPREEEGRKENGNAEELRGEMEEA